MSVRPLGLPLMIAPPGQTFVALADLLDHPPWLYVLTYGSGLIAARTHPGPDIS